MPALPAEPEVLIERHAGLPFLVEHWYLGSRTRRYMMVRRFREVLERADPKPGERVLDLGCGWGYGTLWARTLGCRVAGVDLALDPLRWACRALEQGAQLGLAQANARELPFRDETFDRAISVEMMEHVFRPDRHRVFEEIARVLKPGGRLSLSTPNSASPLEVVKQWAVRWPALRRSLPSSCFPETTDDADSYHPHRYHHPLSLGEIVERLEAASFRVLGTRRFLWVLKTWPDGLLGVARALEGVAEMVPIVRRFGATSLVWAARH